MDAPDPIFYAELTNVRPLLHILRSFLVAKQHQFVTFSLDYDGPFRMLGESDDLSTHCTVSIPSQWFHLYSVSKKVNITVDINKVFNALMLYSKCRRINDQIQSADSFSNYSCVATFQYPCEGAFCVKVRMPQTSSLLESLIYPREQLTMPLDLGFSHYLVSASFVGSYIMVKDCIMTLSSFGCDQIEFKWDPENSLFLFEGIGSMYGSMSCSLLVSKETGNAFSKCELFAFEKMKYSLSSVTAIFGGPNAGAHDMNKATIEMQWHEAGMRIRTEWEHDEHPDTNATGEFVLLPLVI